MSKLLSREAILAANDRPFEDVEVPEWGGIVRVQGMTAGERSKWEASYQKRHKDRSGKTTIEVDWDAQLSFRERLVAMSLVDEAGGRLFSDSDIKALAAKSAAAMERIVNVANRLNGVSQDDMKELEGNSEATETADPYSASLDSSDAPSLNLNGECQPAS